ncbi:MAG: NUDIX domain-containing protein [bacterium]
MSKEKRDKIFTTRKVSMVVYRTNQGKIEFFVGQRPNGGIWQYPTGTCEKGESYEQTAKREVVEELGQVKIKIFFTLDKYLRFKTKNDSYVEKVFAIEIEAEKKVEDKEFEKFKWLDERKVLRILHYDNHKKMIKIASDRIQKKQYPKIFIFCGPGGGGKDSVIDLIQEEFDFTRPKTYVTRPLRRDGKEWRIHVSEKKFKELEKSGAFIESNFFGGYWYATPKQKIEEALNNGKNLLIDIDINGLLSFKKIYSQVVSIFVWTQMSDLERRLRSRGCHSDEYIEKRMKIAAEEVAKKSLCNYVVENKDGKLNETVKLVRNILKKEISE